MVCFSIGSVRARVRVSFWVEALLCAVLGARAEGHPVAVAVFAVVMYGLAMAQVAGYALLAPKEGAELELVAANKWRSATAEPQEKPLRVLLGGVVSVLLVALAAGGVLVWVGGGEPGLYARTLVEADIPEALTQSSSPAVALLLAYLARVSAIYALVNTLPIFPYDGGAAVCRLTGAPRRVYIVSMLLAGAMAIGAMALGWWLVAVFMLLLSMGNYARAYLGVDESIKRS